MADFIYNNFPEEPNEDNFFDEKPERSAGEIANRRNNTLLIVVSVLFAVLILVTAIMGTIMISKLEGSLSGKSNVDSLIFSSPAEQTPAANPPSTQPSTEEGSKEFSSIAEVVYSVKDSVVEIKTTFNQTSSSAGSGVIIGSYKVDGVNAGYYVVTNAHVIQDDNGSTSSDIKIRTSDGTEYAVSSVRGIDSYGDIAVLMVNTTDSLTGAKFGNSDAIVLGQEVIAIGNPLGELGGSVTNGIISALDREIEIDGNVFNLLQTNAAINSGNSGGGLFNMKGELIGIVNAKSSGLGIEGIGFAIPSNDAKAIVEDIIEFGYAKGRPYIGVTASIITDRFSSYVYVHDLEEGYNDNNLQVQDIIITMNDVDIHDLNDFRAVVSKTKPGDKITAYVKRGYDYVEVTITVFEKVS